MRIAIALLVLISTLPGAPAYAQKFEPGEGTGKIDTTGADAGKQVSKYDTDEGVTELNTKVKLSRDGGNVMVHVKRAGQKDFTTVDLPEPAGTQMDTPVFSCPNQGSGDPFETMYRLETFQKILPEAAGGEAYTAEVFSALEGSRYTCMFVNQVSGRTLDGSWIQVVDEGAKFDLKETTEIAANVLERWLPKPSSKEKPRLPRFDGAVFYQSQWRIKNPETQKYEATVMWDAPSMKRKTPLAAGIDPRDARPNNVVFPSGRNLEAGNEIFAPIPLRSYCWADRNNTTETHEQPLFRIDRTVTIRMRMVAGPPLSSEARVICAAPTSTLLVGLEGQPLAEALKPGTDASVSEPLTLEVTQDEVKDWEKVKP